MASGMEMLFKSMGINPAQIMQQAAGIGQAFTSIQERLARLEDNQRLIMMALNIPIEVSSEIMQLAHEQSAEYLETQRKTSNG